MTSQRRVAIIGCGRMGREHARAATMLGARVSVLCDLEVANARKLAAVYPQSDVVSDWREIDWSGVDAVFVCTPPSGRGLVECSAAEAGVPLFLEKPIGISAGQCLPLYRQMKTRPVIHAVGYMNRYRSSVLLARQFLSQGEPVGIACNWVGTPYRVGWWLDRAYSGGPFNEQATHFVDLCRFLVGEIVEVFALGRRSEIRADVDDAVTVTLRFAGGVLGTLLYSCRATCKQIGIEVFSAAGRLRLEGWNLCLSEAEQGATEPEDIYAIEDAAFFRAVNLADQSLVRSSLADALQTQLVVDAIHASLRSHRPEPVETVERVSSGNCRAQAV
jgi:myo-inositol 2-dehydrogenase / D-chiro-inositol 1-dehydrogenase